MGKLVDIEIGARCKRRRKDLYDEYQKDMRCALNECKRVLKKNTYFALVFGQGEGHVRRADVVRQIWTYIERDLGFSKVFDTGRKVRFHRIRFPTVMSERVAVFRSP